MTTIRFAKVCARVCVRVLAGALLSALLHLPAQALELRGEVESVTADFEVRVVLPEGAAAAVGDEVRIEAEIPGVGAVAIQTRWRVSEVGTGFVVARPDDAPSGTPQKGYAAIIETATEQGGASATVTEQPAANAGGGVPVQDCDRLAASPLDPQALTDGVPKEQVRTEEAIRVCRQAVEQFPGSGRLAFQLARAYDIAGDTEHAIFWYREGADFGSLAAMNNLANAYLHGEGVAQNTEEALRWYTRAAERGLTVAMLNLAAVYEAGDAVGQDLEAARTWLKKAAKAGNVMAMSRLGRMARFGTGTEQNFEEAASWYKSAARAGDGDAMHILGTFYEVGLGVRQDQRRAVEWHMAAGKAGNTDGMIAAAQAFDRGQGVPEDRKAAADWYGRAANSGSRVGMYALAQRFRDGNGVRKDPGEAFQWFERAAEAGITAAHYDLAAAYDDGRGVRRDPEAAAGQMMLALKGGHIFSEQQMISNSRVWSDRFRRSLQQLMKDEGVYAGPIDGKFGSGTRRAIEELTP